jgi:NAD(P)-dependent dehydrogenase (short-subunit alcohol dehydrogenase family)
MIRHLHSSDRSVRVALVTGANRGVGLEVCRQLAERDFVVLLTARDAGKSNSAAKKLAQVSAVEPLALDVASASSIKKAAAEVGRRYGCLEVLVNNAGINYDTWERVENADISGTVMETITNNLLGPWLVCQAFLPLLKKVEPAELLTFRQNQDRSRTWVPVRLHIRSRRLP